VLRRLRAIGCPLDWDHLAVPLRPLRITVTATCEGTNVFSVPGGTGIVLGVQVFASTKVTIVNYMLEADWLSTPASWVEPCAEHEGKYCFHECSIRPEGLHFNARRVLNHMKSSYNLPDAGTFAKGTSTNGILLATLPRSHTAEGCKVVAGDALD